MQPIVRALRLFGRERGLWRYALRPLGWAALAYFAVVFFVALLGERLGERLASGLGSSVDAGGAIGAATGLVISIVLGGSIYLALVALVSGFGFDRLSQEVERREFGVVVGQSPDFAAGALDGVGRALLAAVLGLLSLCLSWSFVGPWLIASLLCLMDFTAPSLLRRGVGLGGQFGRARRLPGALPFACLAGILMLVPVVNVLALPVLVAAGTILVAEPAGRPDP